MVRRLAAPAATTLPLPEPPAAPLNPGIQSTTVALLPAPLGGTGLGSAAHPAVDQAAAASSQYTHAGRRGPPSAGPAELLPFVLLTTAAGVENVMGEARREMLSTTSRETLVGLSASAKRRRSRVMAGTTGVEEFAPTS